MAIASFNDYSPVKYTVIPDIHGRPFWRDAVNDVETVPVVFLGDYLDPYPKDRVKWSDALKGLNDIVALKRRYPSQVTLLLGNHDVHYLPGYPYFATSTRYNHDLADMIRNFFVKNLDIFDVAKVIPRKDSRYPFLLTHAGIRRSWIAEMARIAHPESPAVLKFILELPEASGSAEAMAKMLNDALHTDQPDLRAYLFNMLASIPYSRGGHGSGSCVWTDIADLHQNENDLLFGSIQLVGHTRQFCFNAFSIEMKEPTNAYCLDYGRAFTLEPGTSPFIKFKMESKHHFYPSDLMAAPEFFIFGLWLWNLDDTAKAEAESIIQDAVRHDKVRIYAPGAYYVNKGYMSLFRKDGDPDLNEWTVRWYRNICRKLPGMAPEDLMSAILGYKLIDRYHLPKYPRLRWLD